MCASVPELSARRGAAEPLTKDIVDTSANPGRSELRNGFIESVGSVMWLGDGLWQALGKSAPDWSVLPWLQVEAAGGYVRIQAAEHPFSSATGADGERQDGLRTLIFGTAVAAS
jgi:hypothetical protein